MSDLCFRPAFELRQRLLAGEFSAVELLQVFAEQVERHNPTLNALVTLDLDAARERAGALDDSLARGDTPGLLHGLPLAVKDVFGTRGLRSTYGNPHFRDHIPTADDILVERERAAGAVIVGKSNTPDCASGGVTSNELFGLTRNPWNLDKTTSGSGGGGVAALAGGMVALADGSDIGGSVRSPAAWTGCVGFRPSSGRIPGPPGAMADGGTSTAGVFSRCVRDAALFLQAVDGPDLRSATAYPAGAAINHESLNELPAGLRLGWSADFAGLTLDDELADLFERQRAVFERCGHQLSDEQLALGADYRQLYADFNAYGYVRGLPEKVLRGCLDGAPTKPSIRANVERYMAMSAGAIFEMFRARELLRVRAQQFFREHDAIVTPVHSCRAFGVDDPEGEAACDWSALYLAPLLGLPSIVLPAGFTTDDMPHGIMITGRVGEDQLLLQIAAAFERESGHWSQRPPGY